MLDFMYVFLYGLHRDVNNVPLAKISKWLCMPPPAIEPATPCFLACPLDHSAIGRDIDMLLELLQYFLIKRYYKNYCRVQGIYRK